MELSELARVYKAASRVQSPTAVISACCAIPLTMGEISKKLGHSTGAATGAVDRTEKLGWVERIRDKSDPDFIAALERFGRKSDRRTVVVRVTQKGMDQLANIMASYAASESTPAGESK